MSKSDFGERLLNKVLAEIPKLSSRLSQLEKYIFKLIVTILEKIPRYESVVLEMVEFAFGPRQIFYHFLFVVGLQLITSGVEVGRSLLLYLWRLLTVKGRREIKLLKDLTLCTSYADWRAVAAQLDQLRGLDAWRISDASAFYDYRVLRKRILDTIQMIQRGDVFNLIFRLRGGLARDQFGITHAALFSKAMAGTKSIIENYHETVSNALNFIVDSPIAQDEIPSDAKLAFFNETRHAYGRTALLLSGGAYLGFYHVGVARALWKEGLLPRVISGASAGSLTAVLLGTRTNEELDKMLLRDEALHESLENFHVDFLTIDTIIKSPLGAKVQSWIPLHMRKYFDPILTFLFDGRFANIDNDHFRETVKHNVGEITFQEAFDRTGRIINVVVAPLNSYEPPRLLNYLTAPHVCVWSAAVASCAIPGVFDSTALYCKEPNGDYRPEHEWSGQRSAFADAESHLAHAYSDGSFENDLPMEQLSELFNVNHFIVSQVNVHSAFLSSLFLPNPWWNNSTLFGALVAYIRFLKSHVHDWLKNVINMITQNSGTQSWATRRGLVQTLLQDYEGREKDVTITPWRGHINVIQACLSILKVINSISSLIVMTKFHFLFVLFFINHFY